MLRSGISRNILIIQTIAVAWLVGSVHAQPDTEASSLVPLTITSETMTVKTKENKAIFDSNVVIKKGDLTITADHVEILLEPDFASDAAGGHSTAVLPDSSINEGAISQLRVTGNVKMEQGARRAESQEAIYDRREEKIVLLGKPVLFEKDYQVSGTKMTFYLKDNKSTVEDSQVLFHPRESGDPSITGK